MLIRQVGSYEAKTHLPALLEEVERGETIEITRHGRPIARIVPAATHRARVEDIAEALEKARAGVTLGDASLRDLIDEGRR